MGPKTDLKNFEILQISQKNTISFTFLIRFFQERDEIRAAEHRANVLNIIGDLPSAEVEPDKNVLFICKLNPVTADEDLEIIFSRFGEIKR